MAPKSQHPRPGLAVAAALPGPLYVRHIMQLFGFFLSSVIGGSALSHAQLMADAGQSVFKDGLLSNLICSSLGTELLMMEHMLAGQHAGTLCSISRISAYRRPVAPVVCLRTHAFHVAVVSLKTVQLLCHDLCCWRGSGCVFWPGFLGVHTATIVISSCDVIVPCRQLYDST